MKFTAKLLASALMLIVPLVLGSAAYAGTSRDDNKDSGPGKMVSSVNNSSSKNDSGKKDSGKNESKKDDKKDGKKDGKKDDRNDDRDDDHDGHGNDDGDEHDGHGNGHDGKVYVCHITGSSNNPYILIKVAASAVQTHYNHGDPLEFTKLGHGKCAPPPTVSLSLAPNPIYVNTGTTTLSWTSTNATSCVAPFSTTSGSLPFGPYTSIGTVPVTVTCTGPGGSTSETINIDVVASTPPTLVELTACSPLTNPSNDMLYYWAVDYNVETGHFTGIAPNGGAGIEGTVSFTGDGAIMVPGKTIALTTDELIGVSTPPIEGVDTSSFLVVAGPAADPTSEAVFYLTLTVPGTGGNPSTEDGSWIAFTETNACYSPFR